MVSLLNLYNQIGLNQRIVSIFKNEIIPPYTYDLNPIDRFTYPFPPFLIPIFVDGDHPSYQGIIYHPFSERNMVFVKYDLSAGYMWEIARNSEQLLTGFLINSIKNNDDEIDSEIKDFAAKINIDIDNTFVQTYKDLFDGSAFRTFKYFDSFSKETPAAFVQDLNNYTGDFPSLRGELNTKSLNHSSELEIHESVNLGEIQNLPIWFNENKLEAFNQFIDTQDFNSAWLTLNSKGWKLKDIVTGLERLNSNFDNDLFHFVTNNWIKGWEEANAPEDEMLY